MYSWGHIIDTWDCIIDWGGGHRTLCTDPAHNEHTKLDWYLLPTHYMFIICSKKSKVNFCSIFYPWHAKILLNLISLSVHCSMVTIIFVVMLHMPMYSGCFGCYKKYSRHPCCFGLTILKIFGFKLIYANLYFPFELYLAFFKVIYLKIKHCL